jgi:hypothetical protein
MVIEPCIRRGDMVYLTGHYGCGKTSLVADLLLGLLDFNDQLDPYKDEKLLAGAWSLVDRRRDFPWERKALIVDSENDPSSWQQHLWRTIWSYRIKPLAEGSSIENDAYVQSLFGRIAHVKSRELGLADRDRIAAIKRLIQRIIDVNAGIVILDYAWRIFAPADNAVTDWVDDGLSPLRDYCKEQGILCFVLAHPPKPTQGMSGRTIFKREPRGTFEQLNTTDCAFYLHRPRTEPKIYFKHEKNRAGISWIHQGDGVTLHFGPEAGGFPKAENLKNWPLDRPLKEDLTTSAEAMLKAMPNGVFSINDLTKEQRGNVSVKTYREHLPFLLRANAVNEVGKKLGEKTVLYTLGRAGKAYLKRT